MFRVEHLRQLGRRLGVYDPTSCNCRFCKADSAGRGTAALAVGVEDFSDLAQAVSGERRDLGGAACVRRKTGRREGRLVGAWSMNSV